MFINSENRVLELLDIHVVRCLCCSKRNQRIENLPYRTCLSPLLKISLVVQSLCTTVINNEFEKGDFNEKSKLSEHRRELA